MSISDESVTLLGNIRSLIEKCCDVSFCCVLLLISGYHSSFSCYFCYLWLQFISNFVYFNIANVNIVIYFYYTFLYGISFYHFCLYFYILVDL